MGEGKFIDVMISKLYGNDYREGILAGVFTQREHLSQTSKTPPLRNLVIEM